MLLNCGVWRRLLRVPWTTRRSNQSILKEISPGCSLEGLMLKLKLKYFGHLMCRADSFEKTLMLVKIEGRRRRGRQRMRCLDGIIDSMDLGLGGLQGLVMGRRAVIHGVTRVRHDEWLNWTELNWESTRFSDWSLTNAVQQSDESSILRLVYKETIGHSLLHSLACPEESAWNQIYPQVGLQTRLDNSESGQHCSLMRDLSPETLS